MPPPRGGSTRNPIAGWHLLSLDAPTVAALWTWSIARTHHIQLPWTSTCAMAVAVWLLYAADRLLDARLLNARLLDARLLDVSSSDPQSLEARHHFHHRHRSLFLIGIALASVALAALLPALPPEAIHLYLIEGSFLAGYFLLIHATDSAHRLPKELAVGLFFAAATFIPTVARQPELRPHLLPAALLFSALCSLNCLFIFHWEHPGRPTFAHPITRAAVGHVRPLAWTLSLLALSLTLFDHGSPWPTPAAVALAAFLLLLLDRYRYKLTAITLRAAADLALLTPLLFLPLR